ncbi:MAG: type IV pili twitching motility protein PilT, partial [Candidatus Aminicenantales bacterium]
MRIDDLLKIAIEMDASDVHVKAGNHPQLRVHGVLVPMTQLPRLTAQDTEDLAFQMLNETQKKKLADEFDLDL